jgi:hypothetical protein
VMEGAKFAEMVGGLVEDTREEVVKNLNKG